MLHARSRLVAGALAVVAAAAGSVAVATDASAATTTVSVDWTAAQIAVANTTNYGINAWRGHAPTFAGYPGNATYKAAMNDLNNKWLRYHNWGVMGDSRTDPNGWIVDPDGACTWDRRKIARALYKSYPGRPARMMNIPSWPGCMQATTATDRLTPRMTIRASAVQQFANWAADLVRTVNVEHKRNVKYWELFNEKDGCSAASGIQPSDQTALAGVFRATAAAMKAVDPTIIVGGPGACNAYQTDLVKAFVAAAGPDLGFFSYHAYIGEYDDVNESDAVKRAHTEGMYDGPPAFASLAAATRSTVNQAAGRTVPVFFDEWGFGGTADNSYRRNNGIGAVFAALSLKQLVLAGVAANYFCDADGRNGLLDANLAKRPYFHVFKLYNSLMLGPVVPATSSAPRSVDALAVKSSNRFSLALANRAQAASPVRVSFAGVPESMRTVTVHSITGTGLTTTTTTVAALTAGDVTLPTDSVTVLTLTS